jgi:hypothetical protein
MQRSKSFYALIVLAVVIIGVAIWAWCVYPIPKVVGYYNPYYDIYFTKDQILKYLELGIDITKGAHVVQNYVPPMWVTDILPWAVGALVPLLILIGSMEYSFRQKRREAFEALFTSPNEKVRLAAIQEHNKRIDKEMKAGGERKIHWPLY